MGVRDRLRLLRRRLDPDVHEPIWNAGDGPPWWAKLLVREELLERARLTRYRDHGHGIDPFGLHPDGVVGGLAITRWLYESYFRVVSYGAENVPADGPVVLASNHSGTLPLDGLMIWADLVRKGPPGRIPRVVVDHFVPSLPMVNIIFTRGGAVGGSRGNFHALLDAGEMVLVFPEGVPGISKSFSDRYQLASWRQGHVELAIRHRAPVVPVAVIGAEEQMPQIAKIESISLFGIPHLPITATPLPLPVRYHLWYGEPIPVHERWSPEQASDPAVVAQGADMVRRAVEKLIAKGLQTREGVFR